MNDRNNRSGRRSSPSGRSYNQQQNRSNNNQRRNDRGPRGNSNRNEGPRQHAYQAQLGKDKTPVFKSSGLGFEEDSQNVGIKGNNQPIQPQSVGSWAGNYIEIENRLLEMIRSEARAQYMEPSFMVNNILREIFVNRKKHGGNARMDDFIKQGVSVVNCPKCGVDIKDYLKEERAKKSKRNQTDDKKLPSSTNEQQKKKIPQKDSKLIKFFKIFIYGEEHYEAEIKKKKEEMKKQRRDVRQRGKGGSQKRNYSGQNYERKKRPQNRQP